MADDQPDAIDPEGPEDDRYKWPIIAHADVEDVDCGGCLWPHVQGDVAEIGCTECGAVVRTVPVGDLQRTYDEIELSLDSIATEICPFCGKVNVFPGWVVDDGLYVPRLPECGPDVG